MNLSGSHNLRSPGAGFHHIMSHLMQLQYRQEEVIQVVIVWLLLKLQILHIDKGISKLSYKNVRAGGYLLGKSVNKRSIIFGVLLALIISSV